jgi:hypothetical protein
LLDDSDLDVLTGSGNTQLAKLILTRRERLTRVQFQSRDNGVGVTCSVGEKEKSRWHTI